jgi:hypothetical protein
VLVIVGANLADRRSLPDPEGGWSTVAAAGDGLVHLLVEPAEQLSDFAERRHHLRS